MRTAMLWLVVGALGCGGADDSATPGESDADTDADSDTDTDTDTDTDVDLDGDGYGSDDCDDANAEINPGADERCDGVDNDCDKETDEAGAVDGTVWFQDADGDGWGGAETTVACVAPDGFVSKDGDCDDGAADTHPDAAEIWYDGVDQDCAGDDDFDQDADGTSRDLDCEDTDPAIHPGAYEHCNEIDDDCDEAIDEDAIDTTAWYVDEDGDGYGLDATRTDGCVAPKGSWSDVLGECDDTDSAVSPAASEVCGDAVDNDCDHYADNCSFDSSLADATLLGEESLDQAGWVVAAAGDVDGDGIPDVLVGAPGSATGGKEAGSSYLVLGPLTDGDLSAAVAQVDGVDVGDKTGTAMTSEDLDDDGVPDFAVGLPGYSPFGVGEGGVAVFFAPVSGDYLADEADAFIGAEGLFDEAGTNLAAAGDMNDDGIADLLVGAPGDSDGGARAGAVFVVTGPVTSGDLTTAYAKIVGASDGDTVGSALGLGDLDGDGIDDLVVAASGEDGGGAAAGAVYLMLGPVTSGTATTMADATWFGEGDNAYAGAALASAGDADGDGNTDILIGSYGYDSFSGAAYVVRADAPTASLADAHARMVGSAAADLGGYSVAGGSDLDGDGTLDVVVGAPGQDGGAASAGAAYIELGPLSGTTELHGAARTIECVDADALFGWSVAIAGDMDDDGRSDVLVGAEGLDDPGLDAGGVYLFLGSSDW